MIRSFARTWYHWPQPRHGAGFGLARLVNLGVGIEPVRPVEGLREVGIEANTQIESGRPRFLDKLLFQLLGNDLVRRIATEKSPSATSGENGLHPIEHIRFVFRPLIECDNEPARTNHTFEARHTKNKLLNTFDVVAEVHKHPHEFVNAVKTAPCFQPTH